MIAILTGGTSAERDVAIRSSKIFLENIEGADYYIFPEDLEKFLANYKKYDLAIPVFHGIYGEDGQIFAFLKTLSIRTAFSPWEVHAITIDKFITDTLIRRAHPVANEFIIKRFMPIPPSPWPFPLIIKPNRGGSTIGTNIVKDLAEYEWAIKEIHINHHDDALVQTLLPGREFTVSLIGNSYPEVLAIAEACNKESLHTFEEKYNGPPEYEVTPAQIPKELEQYLNEKSKEIYVFLGCRGVARIDWRCNAEGVPHFLEINTIPGMTDVSWITKAAAYAGYSRKEFVEKIITLAYE